MAEAIILQSSSGSSKNKKHNNSGKDDNIILLGKTTVRRMLRAVCDEKDPLYERNWYSECGGARHRLMHDPNVGNEAVYVYYNIKEDDTVMTNLEGDFGGCNGSSAGFKGKLELSDFTD